MTRLRSGLLVTGFVAATTLYIYCGYLALHVLPHSLVPASEFGDLGDPATHARLVADARSSVRGGAVALLTSSSLGIAGLVAFLTYSAGRRDARREVRKSQDDLFTKALDLVGRQDVPVVVGAVSLLGTLAESRPDLRGSVLASLFTLVRSRLLATKPIENKAGERSVEALFDREPVAYAALRTIGLLPAGNRLGGDPGGSLRRRLDNCDLRRWTVDGARFEQINFVGCYLWESRFVNCQFVKCTFQNADWTGADLRKVRFVECDLTMTNLSTVTAIEVQERGCVWSAGDRPVWASDKVEPMAAGTDPALLP